MQLQRPQLRKWNYYYDDIQRGVNSCSSDRKCVDINASFRECWIPDRLNWYTLKYRNKCSGSGGGGYTDDRCPSYEAEPRRHEYAEVEEEDGDLGEGEWRCIKNFRDVKELYQLKKHRGNEENCERLYLNNSW